MKLCDQLQAALDQFPPGATLIKQRLCRSGMRWKEDGAQMIISLRALLLTPTRWDQFWRKLQQYGAPAIDSY
jgi:hypothetical protein